MNTQTLEPYFTPTELKVLELIAQGKQHKQIAHMFDMSIRTVEAHIYHVKEKKELHSHAELIAFAISLRSCKWSPDADYPDYRLRTECGHGTPTSWLGDGFNFIGCPYCMRKIEVVRA